MEVEILGRFIWTIENVTEILDSLYIEKKLSYTFLEKHYSGLLRACSRKFGSLKEVLEKMGIPYEEVLKTEKWTNLKIDKLLQNMYKEGELTLENIKERGGLACACKRVYGSIEAALEINNIPYEEIRKTKKWTKEKVDLTLINLYQQGLLKADYLNKKEGGLYRAAKKIYGTIQAALKSLEIPLEEVYAYEMWNEEKVINTLKERVLNDLSIKSSVVIVEYPALHGASLRLFKTYENAIKKAGFLTEEVYEMTNWSKEKIIAELERLGEEKINQVVNFALEYRPLYKACIKNFKSFEEACKYAHIHLREKHERVYIEAGRKFEGILSRVLTECNFKFKSNPKMGNNRPDFVFDNGVWADAKLSKFTSSIDKTIKKYAPNCKELWIIYCIGGIERQQKSTEKVHLVSVWKFINMLPESRKNYYTNEIKRLIHWFNEEKQGVIYS